MLLLCAISPLFGIELNGQTLPYAGPTFLETNRLERLRSVCPAIDRIFHEFVEKEHIPGLVYGIVLDNALVHTGVLGFAHLQARLPVQTNTAFRIASMTKSFVALAAYKLRDAGKLNLDDAVSKFLPEFERVQPPTSDSGPITVRHLMTMSSGLLEDNPWGDRQMAITREALAEFVRGGLSFSNPPGEEYEYSNLGFVLLGQVISRVSGQPFQQYISEQLLQPLGMRDTRWEYTSFGGNQLALGYRWEDDTWKPEPILHDGEGAACGGLITTLSDFARYVEMHLAAWPARNDTESAPIRRATLREFDKPFTFISIAATNRLLDGTTANPAAVFYGNGLAWSVDSRGRIALAHSGGLPGYGSNYRFLPDYGVAVIAFANRTYAPAGLAVSKAIDIIVEQGKLGRREVSVSGILGARKDQIAQWILSWNEQLTAEIAAENFFLDRSPEAWRELSRSVFGKLGAIQSIGPVKPVNQLRGTFPMVGEKGTVEVWFTLTPEKVPKVQELKLTFRPR